MFFINNTGALQFIISKIDRHLYYAICEIENSVNSYYNEALVYLFVLLLGQQLGDVVETSVQQPGL